MSKKLNIRGGLTATTKGKRLFEVEGKTVGECLNHLVSLVPKMEEALFYKTEKGPALRSTIEVLVNSKSTDLVTEVNDGDEIKIKKNVQ